MMVESYHYDMIYLMKSLDSASSTVFFLLSMPRCNNASLLIPVFLNMSSFPHPDLRRRERLFMAALHKRPYAGAGPHVDGEAHHLQELF